jgi:hypothetical protein
MNMRIDISGHNDQMAGIIERNACRNIIPFPNGCDPAAADMDGRRPRHERCNDTSASHYRFHLLLRNK